MWRPAKQGGAAVGNVQPGEPVCYCRIGFILIFLLVRFAVVGVMEQFETSIAMMEAILPRFGETCKN